MVGYSCLPLTSLWNMLSKVINEWNRPSLCFQGSEPSVSQAAHREPRRALHAPVPSLEASRCTLEVLKNLPMGIFITPKFLFPYKAFLGYRTKLGLQKCQLLIMVGEEWSTNSEMGGP